MLCPIHVVRSAICRQRVLCRTLAGNVCDMLTITECKDLVGWIG